MTEGKGGNDDVEGGNDERDGECEDMTPEQMNEFFV